MGKSMSKESIKIFDRITAKLREVGKVNCGKLTADGYMPLSVENLSELYNQPGTWSLCHYGKMNGDLMRDPEMVFIRDDQGLRPIYFRNDYMGYEDSTPNTGMYDFARIWLKNIKEQGFLA